MEVKTQLTKRDLVSEGKKGPDIITILSTAKKPLFRRIMLACIISYTPKSDLDSVVPGPI